MRSCRVSDELSEVDESFAEYVAKADYMEGIDDDNEIEDSQDW